MLLSHHQPTRLDLMGSSRALFSLPWLWPLLPQVGHPSPPHGATRIAHVCVPPLRIKCVLLNLSVKLRGQTVETPGLSPWLPFLLCPFSHPGGLIQALEFKYQPPAQDSYVYVFSSGLSLQPSTASPPGHPVHVFSSLGLKLSCSSPLAAASVLAIPFVSFFLLMACLQSDRNSSLALPSESVQNLSAAYTSLWLLPGCRSSFVWVTLWPSDSFSASLLAPLPPLLNVAAGAMLLKCHSNHVTPLLKNPAMAVSLWNKSSLQCLSYKALCDWSHFLSDISCLPLLSLCLSHRAPCSPRMLQA